MKKITLFAIVTFLIAFCFPQHQLDAQEGKADKEKERELEQVIVKQKKAMNDAKRAEKAEIDIDIDEDQIEEELQRVEEELENSGLHNFHFYNNGRRSFSFDGVPNPPVPPDPGMFYWHSSGDTERTTWEFSKSVKENSFSGDYTFDVEKTAKGVVMSIMGDCKAGEIKISIEMPDGKNYSDIVLDEFGNLNWRKSFNISETENQDNTGKWKFNIDSKKATGYFKISLQTY